jgi:hypothetical protein
MGTNRKTTLSNNTNRHQTHHQNKRSHPVATPAEGGKSPRPAWYTNPQPTGTHQPISKHNTPAHTPPTHSHVLCDAGTVAVDLAPKPTVWCQRGRRLLGDMLGAVNLRHYIRNAVHFFAYWHLGGAHRAHALPEQLSVFYKQMCQHPHRIYIVLSILIFL